MDDLRQYRQFLAVAEEGNFRRAAEKLGLTHGALSQTVMRLEDTYRVKLFERTKRGMVPTAYGRLLVEKAYQVIDLLETFRKDVSRLEKRELGKLVIGCDPNYSATVVAPTVHRLMESYPNWVYEVRASPWTHLQDQFESREIDVYVGLRPTDNISPFSAENLNGLPGVFVCRPGHPLAQRRAIKMSEVLRYQLAFLYLPKLESDVDGYDPALNIETNDVSLLKYIIQKTDVVGPGLLNVFLEELENGSLKLLNVVNYPGGNTIADVRANTDESGLSGNDIMVLSHKTNAPIPALIEFKKALREVVDELAETYDELRSRFLKS